MRAKTRSRLGWVVTIFLAMLPGFSLSAALGAKGYNWVVCFIAPIAWAGAFAALAAIIFLALWLVSGGDD